MKIDTADGSLSFDRGSVRRGQSRGEFLATALGSSASQELVNEEWWHLRVEPEPGFHADVLFRGDRLWQVYVLMDIVPDGLDEWTEKNELERKAVHDRWLRRHLGEPPYEYGWGSVSSEFDAKGCVSEIIVSYAS